MFVVRALTLLIVVVALSFLYGCSTSSGIEMLGEARPAIESRQVQLVESAPEAAQQIARITTNYSYGVRETDEEKRRYAIERARVQAAKLGANLLVIDKVGYQETASGAVTGGLYDGQTVSSIPAQRTPVVYATAYYLE